MSGSRRMLWLLWATFLVLLTLEVWAAHTLPRRDPAWHSAQTAVAGFVLALFSLAAGVGTFALREPLALKHVRAGTLDPETPAGFARIRTMLVTLWALCLLIGSFGGLVAWGAASPYAGCSAYAPGSA